jgi:hypothetical protein
MWRIGFILTFRAFSFKFFNPLKRPKMAEAFFLALSGAFFAGVFLGRFPELFFKEGLKGQKSQKCQKCQKSLSSS